jgi:hypothetical protein
MNYTAVVFEKSSGQFGMMKLEIFLLGTGGIF